MPLTPQILTSPKTSSITSNTNRDTDESEDDEIHLNQGKGDVDSLVMVEGNQPPSMDQHLKEAETEKSPHVEELEDSGNSSTGSHIRATPSINLPILVDQETFTDLRKRDSMVALGLVFENQKSILAFAQSTPPSASSDPSVVPHDQILQQFKAKLLNVDLVQSLRQDDGSYFEIKGLVESLTNSPETTSNKELLHFLLGFGPLLDTLA